MSASKSERSPRKIEFTYGQLGSVLDELDKRRSVLNALLKRMERHSVSAIAIDGQKKMERALELIDQWTDYAEIGYRKAARDSGEP